MLCIRRVILLAILALLIAFLVQTSKLTRLLTSLQFHAGLTEVSLAFLQQSNEQTRIIPNATLRIVPYNSESVKLTSHWCHSRDFAKEHGKRASCLFQNICVVPTGENDTSKQEVTFLYVSEKNEQQDDESTSFTLGVGPHSVDERVYFQPHYIAREQLDSKYPNRHYVKDLSVLFYEYNAQNFGHVLGDVVLPIYALLESFQLEHHPFNLFRYSMSDPIGWSCDFQKTQPDRQASAWVQCERFYQQIPQLLRGHSPIHVLNSSTIQPTCFQRVAVGMPMHSDDCLEGSHGMAQDTWSTCNHGRQGQFWNFRNYALANAGVSTLPPNKHLITITKRTDGARALHNLDDLITALQNQFAEAHIDIVTVEWHTLPLVEQLDLIRNTTVHITPPGGISYIAIFLNKWATSIRLYSENSFGMDHHLFHYLGYMTNEHVDCKEGMIPINDTVKLVRDGLQRYDTFRIADGDVDWKAHRLSEAII